jgi:RimJ/RimL family protein N-acetyltransferase
MKYDKNIIQGRNISLRNIKFTDCNEKYVRWLNDKEVNKYLDSRLAIQTLESIQTFVSKIVESEDNYMFAIIDKEDRHIGNIKIGPIHPVYKSTSIGYLIGEKKHWGSGLGTEAVYLATRFCFDILNLHKVNAGIIAPNIQSARILEKIGFRKEACIREAVVLDNEQYTDIYYFGILAGEICLPYAWK